MFLVATRPSSEDRTGRAIVLMPGPYDSHGKKVNEARTYDVFGSHSRFSCHDRFQVGPHDIYEFWEAHR